MVRAKWTSKKRIKGCGKYTNHWFEVTATDHNRGLVMNPDIHSGGYRCGQWTVPGHWQCVCARCVKKAGLVW